MSHAAEIAQFPSLADRVSFSRAELSAILGLYGRMVAAGLWRAGRGVTRTRYRPAHWGARESLVAAGAALSAAGRIYRKPEMLQKAEQIRQTIRAQSFDGQFFVDNAVRKDGKLEVTRNRSEVCQYFAFYFDVATPKSHADLWQILRDRFGPQRKDNREFPEVHPANSFIGNMLRMELLSRAGRSQQILDESVAYLLYMADRTGTLWENVGDYASCNHGFASHICHTLYRDVLGLYRVDRVNKRVALRFGALELENCEGSMPTPDGAIRLSWRKEPDKVVYRLSLPEGYEAESTNLSGRELVRDN